MLSAKKLKKVCKERKITVEKLAEHIVKAGLDKKQAISAIKNWQNGLIKPIPRKADIANLATALGVEANAISSWTSFYKYAPGSASKARLVTQLISGRRVQDAMDILKFTKKRASSVVNKILKSAIADADEQQADVDNLYVSEARVDDAGLRIGTKQYRAKDRGRAHSIRKKACHIYVTVAEA